MILLYLLVNHLRKEGKLTKAGLQALKQEIAYADIDTRVWAYNSLKSRLTLFETEELFGEFTQEPIFF